jgi:hypothetical protein
MLESAPDSLHGRCPMCSQRVTLTFEMRRSRVECPRCHHRESGGVFIDTETPVAILLVDGGRPDPETIALPASSRAGALGGLTRDEERTHLLLDAESVLDDAPEPRRPEPPPPRAPAPRRSTPDEARTHLLLDPVDLKDEAEPALPRRDVPAAPGSAIALGRVLDEIMHERWRAALALLALACGILPPLLDGLSETEDATVSLVASFLVPLGLATFGLAWMSRPRSAHGLDTKHAMSRVRAACARLTHDLSELRHSPRYLRLALAGQVAALAGVAGITLSSLLSLLRALVGSFDPPSLFRLLCGILALAGAGLSFFARRAAPAAAPGPDDFAESVAAARHLPPLVDLEEPLPASFIGGYTTFHKALVVMAQWRADPGPDEDSCRAALERHLQRHLSGCRVERDRWLGPRRRDGVASLLVDGMILIEVWQGFAASDAERALAAMRGHARRWADKPMILCVFGAPRAALFESAVTASLVELHEAAPFVAARMPTRR